MYSQEGVVGAGIREDGGVEGFGCPGEGEEEFPRGSGEERGEEGVGAILV